MAETKRVALIVGTTGIAGLNLAKKMVSTDKYGKWKVYGLSRRTSEFLPAEVTHISCDLLDVAQCKERMAPLGDVTHVFYVTWMNKVKESDNMETNGVMLNNLLDNLPKKPKHLALLTGSKHYMGPFDAVGKCPVVFPTPYKESFGRLPCENYYYTLEDIVYKRAEKEGFSWSVSRPGIIMGMAPYAQVNFGTTIAVYAAICKYAGRPFSFPGDDSGYNILWDVTDAGVLAEHMMWQSTDPGAKNKALNVNNGDVFRYHELWKTIAGYFDLPVTEKLGPAFETSELESIWNEMVQKKGLKPYKLNELSAIWFLPLALRIPQDAIMDMSQSRELGFNVYYNTEKCFFDLFDSLRKNKIIP